jgi:beta-mannosidase
VRYIPSRIIIINALFIMLNACHQKETTVLCEQINNNWQFEQAGTDAYYEAEVPGCVHLDLYYNDLIEDPFFRDNENKLQWIEKEDWVYKTSFNISSDILASEAIELVFQGIDTYAEVFLNGKYLFSADNMFRTWAFKCKDILKQEGNELELRFTSPVKVDKEKSGKVPYALPDIRGFSRKAPYHYGWDWGPRFVTSGIWRPVSVLAWKKFMVDDVWIQQKDISSERADLSARLVIESTCDQNVNVSLIDEAGEETLYTNEFKLTRGSNIINFNFQVSDPKLWWPHDLGDPFLYNFNIMVENEDLYDSRKVSKGLRRVELVLDPDEKGSSFSFLINGKPLFIRGANYIPQESFVPRLRDEDYERVINTARAANMNMLRVWGGGIYEEDIFYDLCDRIGILVWQDFMFACNMYPGDSSFLENVRAEATDNVIRLRNHPCIALWCGNNEVEEAWKHWSWQKELGYSFSDSVEVWNNYVKVFHEILPAVIDQHDPEKDYWPSSPSMGWGMEAAYRSGDVHYWGVWWGEEPFKMYEQKIGRFMSEFGFQGMPDIKTIEKFTLPEDREIGSEVMESHQKHPSGTRLIQTYMERDYPVPEGFEDYVYVSQLVQADGIRLALEAHRRAKPYCMGTLYWQLNDCWPVSSWASIDYFGRWKALHYHAKKAFQPIIISCAMDSLVKFHVINDSYAESRGRVEIIAMDFNGKVIWEHTQEIEIPSNCNQLVLSKTKDEITGGRDKNGLLLLMRILKDGTITTQNIKYFSSPKNLILQDAGINYQMDSIPNGIRITLQSDKLVKGVYLSSPDQEEFYSDNYFDMLPGVPLEIDYYGTYTAGELKEKLKIKSLNSIMSNL